MTLDSKIRLLPSIEGVISSTIRFPVYVIHKAMITFTSYPSNLGNIRHAQSKQVGTTQDVMDVDDFQDSDFGVGSNTLTCPGEYLTSSQTYMRCALNFRPRGKS